MVTALRQDVEWIREHTRLSVAAARWQAKTRVSGAADDLLLRGGDLTEAKLWAARRKENAPEITALLQSFLEASEAYAASLADAERERLRERERLIAETEVAQRRIAAGSSGGRSYRWRDCWRWSCWEQGRGCGRCSRVGRT